MFAEALETQLEANVKTRVSHRCVMGKIVKKYRRFNTMRSIGSYALLSRNALKFIKKAGISKEIRYSIEHSS